MGTTEQNKIGFLDILTIVLSIYVLVALLIDTFFALPTEISNVLMTIDNGICFIFLIDFLVRFFYAEDKLKFMRWGWIDLLSSIPYVEILRTGRLFRLIKLLRVLRAFRSTRILIKHIFKSKIKGTMTAVVIITILIVIFSSISILVVETDPNSNIKTSEDALWWTIETVTTVGYGDKYPVTSEGRLIGVIVMIVGVGLFGTFTGYIATLFTEEKRLENESNEKYSN
ncbi:MAG TPA: ion transporter [Prolixibacteraceae bacterium]|nr:ion transporter [Prolixibacteraceae bacterium]